MGGVTGCPCVSTTALFNGKVRPEGWGDTCSTWDLIEDYYNGTCFEKSPHPDWCSDSWCYVDPANCDQPNYPSKLGVPPAEGMHWSYKTCDVSGFTGNSWVVNCECTSASAVYTGGSGNVLGGRFNGKNASDRPVTWGSYCAAWNKGDGVVWPSCDTSWPNTPADWCDDAWCYVLKSECTDQVIQNSTVIALDSLGIGWTYTGCYPNGKYLNGFVTGATFLGNTWVGLPTPPPPSPP